MCLNFEIRVDAHNQESTTVLLPSYDLVWLGETKLQDLKSPLSSFIRRNDSLPSSINGLSRGD